MLFTRRLLWLLTRIRPDHLHKTRSYRIDGYNEAPLLIDTIYIISIFIYIFIYIFLYLYICWLVGWLVLCFACWGFSVCLCVGFYLFLSNAFSWWRLNGADSGADLIVLRGVWRLND